MRLPDGSIYEERRQDRDTTPAKEQADRIVGMRFPARELPESVITGLAGAEEVKKEVKGFQEKIHGKMMGTSDGFDKTKPRFEDGV